MTEEALRHYAAEYGLKAIPLQLKGEVTAFALTGFRDWQEMEETSMELDAEIALFRCPDAGNASCLLSGDKRAAVDFSFGSTEAVMASRSADGLTLTGILIYTS